MALTQTIDRPQERPAPETHLWQRDALAALSPLLVGGTALLCLLLAFVLVGLVTAPLSEVLDRADVWVPYLVLGTVFPLVVAAIVLGQRSGRAVPAVPAILLTALPIAAAAIVAGPLNSLIAAELALVQTVICLVLVGRQEMRLSVSVLRRTPTSLSMEIDGLPPGVLANLLLPLLVMGFISWTVALELLTWQGFSIWKGMAEVMPPSLRVFIGGAIALMACCWWAFGKAISASRMRSRPVWVTNVLCVVGLVLLAFRTDGLFTTDRLGVGGTFYHWGPLVGPAEAVRQGGWLLWDVPSPYGFLTTLSLAALPVATTWQSLYLLNAIGSALVGLFLFFALRAARPTVVGSIIAASVSAAVVLLLPINAPYLFPEHFLPQSGALRFGWSFVLVALLLLVRRQEPGSRSYQLILLAGCLCWLLAMLWSFDSAFHGSAIWIPALVFIVLRDYGGLGRGRDWKQMVFWLLLPPLILAGALGSIVAIYRHFLGHGPDLWAYVEAAIAFTGQYLKSSLEAGHFEGVGFLGGTGVSRTIFVVLFGLLLLAMAAAAVARTNAGLKDVPTLIGLAFGIWAHSSYPLGVPIPNSIYRQMPFLVLALGILVGIIAPRYFAEHTMSWDALVKAGSIPLLVAILVSAYTNVSELRYYADAIRAEGFHGDDVTVGLPRVEPSLARLLEEAEVNATDPILYAAAPLGDLMPVWTPSGETSPVRVSRQWMREPLADFVILPEDRRQVFVERYFERRGAGGWLIERRKEGVVVDQGNGIDAWFFEPVAKFHTPTKIAQNADWQLVWYEPRSGSEGAALAGPQAGRVPGLPSDLFVNGQSLAESVLPPVWGYFGPEWTNPAIDKQPRCTGDEGSLYLFTPSSLEAWVALDPPQGGFAGTLHVAVNNGEAVDAGRVRKRDAVNGGGGNQVQAPVHLDRGWNTVTFTLGTAGQSEAAAADSVENCEAADGANSALRLKTADVRFKSRSSDKE